MKLLSIVSSTVLGSALLLVATGASAQDRFGRAGQFAVSAERLFGVVRSSESVEETDVDTGITTTTTDSYTTITLLANPTGSLVSRYSFARLAGDYFVIDGLTVGAALGYFHVSGSTKAEAQGTSIEQDTGSGNGFLLAPRVGYAFMFTDVIGLWPRLGITYINTSGENDDGTVETSGNRLALTVEVPLVISPVPHAGFTIGPALDLGLSGTDKSTRTNPAGVQIITETSPKATDIGLHAGMFLYF